MLLDMVVILASVVRYDLKHFHRFSNLSCLPGPQLPPRQIGWAFLRLCSFCCLRWGALAPLAASDLGAAGHRGTGWDRLRQQPLRELGSVTRNLGERTPCVMNLGDERGEVAVQLHFPSFLLERTALSSFEAQPAWRHPRWLSSCTC